MIPPCRRVVDSGVWAYQAYTVCTCCRARGRGLWRGSLPASGPTLTPYLIKINTQTKKWWLKRNRIAWGITVHCKICNTDSLSKEHSELEYKQAELCCYISLTNLYIRHRIFCFILGKYLQRCLMCQFVCTFKWERSISLCMKEQCYFNVITIKKGCRIILAFASHSGRHQCHKYKIWRHREFF